MKAHDSTKVLRNADGWPASVKFVDGFANGWDDLLKERMVDEAGKVVEMKLEQWLAMENTVARTRLTVSLITLLRTREIKSALSESVLRIKLLSAA